MKNLFCSVFLSLFLVSHAFSENILEIYDEALKNEELKKTLALIDWEYIENKINRWKKGEDFDAIFIICLVSLSKFLQITK